MTGLFLLDSNVYIDAFRDQAFDRAFRRFHRQHIQRVVLSAVVASEILTGATTAALMRTFDRHIVEPFVARRRFASPTWAVWRRATDIDRRLRAGAGNKERLKNRSFFHDILIAATARDIGATIITSNVKDFDLIGEHVDITVVTPWPGLAAA